ISPAQRRSHLPLPLPHAAALPRSVAEARQFDLWQRNGDHLPPPLPDHLPARDVPLQILLQTTPHNIVEALPVSLDAFDHSSNICVNFEFLMLNFELRVLRSPRLRCEPAGPLPTPPIQNSSFKIQNVVSVRVSARKNTGYEVQHVGGADVTVSVLADESALDHVDLLLGAAVDDVRHQA